MAGSQRCPDCGSADIVEDAHYSQNQLVCADCGYILTEGLLTHTLTEEGFLQEVRFTDSTGQNESLSKRKLHGMKRVRDLCKVLRLPSTFEDTAVSYYERVFDHASYHLVNIKKKEVLIGCCVYVTCRQHNWPLTMGTICSLIYAGQEKFASIYLRLLQTLKLDVPALSLKDLVMTHCKNFRLFEQSSSVPAHFSEDMQRVVERTLQIVELASETWLVTGRHPIPIITAAAYLAWQSLCPSKRLSCTLHHFCKLANVDMPPPANQRLKEIHAVLLKMASQLPWLSMLNISKKTVVQHVGDILKHRSFLLNKSLHDCAEVTQDNSHAVEAEDPGNLAIAMVGETSEVIHQGDLCKKQNAAKRSFLPPCLMDLKRMRTTTGAAERVFTGEEDISDSEIEQYLRTPREIEEFQQACPWD
ncbi:transcription factor IIIB 50 kDa subunit [Microcaecilia unicolor]|uniref:Transcription factor IIIB 50 kDa subunit n=1 Tax=Microcaecilia unicolor TaxID=1415580 RepID=A0A6P7Y427_9AMPH|nr:transcription factor IIIB 50 kDa subunit [Microcaecilia unicolor]XP_030057814.1 transcription factor IIIB 50 kDa subunit [Microcaecilia unicolor]XP_030057815.1 transcription factor IIIB 50 kDa subunit [Microcaecilia unicolor]